MTCQHCGKRDATVHLVELVDGERKSQWLCPVCAGRSDDEPSEDPWFGSTGKEDSGGSEEDVESLASFLGQVFEPLNGPEPSDLPACSSCGYTLEQFRRTNRLGCPKCYESFRSPLLSILSHLHRHVSHLGKIPGHHGARASISGALGRARVALEKAIAGEDFENAARLRDEIQRLESSENPEGESSS
jgi:protein arginine kinase activator